MYRCINAQNGESIVILAPAWRAEIPALRRLAAQDLLACPGCRQPLIVRAGRYRRPHFAHRYLQGCSHGGDSPATLAARAALYEWLAPVFLNTITLEFLPPGSALPRPVDLWIERSERPWAYWIVDRRLRQPARVFIKDQMGATGASTHWILCADLLKLNPHNAEQVLLSPNERDLLQTSPYDAFPGWNPSSSILGQTLHFLDSDEITLTTLRALQLVHRPNVFAGRMLIHPLPQLSLDPHIGEPVHPGEVERREKLQAEHALQLERERQALENLKKWSQGETIRPLPRPPVSKGADPWGIVRAGGPAPAGAPEYPCVYCGRRTSDWWTNFVVAGERKCKCRACLSKGLG